MLVDTHAHLNFPDFTNNLDQTIKKAKENGVEKIICVSSSVEDSKKAIEAARRYPEIVFAAVGIHPQQTDPENPDPLDSQLDKLDQLVQNPAVVAIGECGLDYTPAPPGEKERTREEQTYLFKKQLELAQNLNLPVIIHSRKAFSDVFSTLKSRFSNLYGVFHCYSAGKREIRQVEELGFYFGIDGNITYDAGLANVAREMPIEKIILETDSPFLTPIPYRGLPNAPQNVKIIAEFIAKLKNLPFEKITDITTQNAEKLFFKTR